MKYLIFALLLVLTLFAIYLHYQKSHDKRRFLTDLGLFGLLVVYGYYSKYMWVVKWLFLVHLSLVIVAIWNFYLRLFKDRGHILWILSPIITIILFFVLGEYFRNY